MAINYMIDGVPMVYCGNELADKSRLSMFANRFYPGAFEFTDRNAAGKQVERRKEIIRKLNTMKADMSVLTDGETEWISTENDSVLAFKRTGSDEQILFAGNFSENDAEVILKNGDVLLSNNATVKNGTVKLSPYGYVIIRRL